MKRSQKTSRARAQRPDHARFVGATRALIALTLGLLQLLSALHFTLVPHGFSAALGGIVHAHAHAQSAAGSASFTSRATTHPLFAPAEPSVCVLDVCPFADAAQVAPTGDSTAVWRAAAFGERALLGPKRARTRPAVDVVSRAPKTSPPA